MFSDPAVSALGFQLEVYRWEDHWRRMREIRENNNNLAVAHAQLDWVVAQHNELVGRYNKLVTALNQMANHVRSLESGIQNCEARTAELQRQLAEEHGEKQRLRARAVELGNQVLERVWADQDRETADRSQQS